MCNAITFVFFAVLASLSHGCFVKHQHSVTYICDQVIDLYPEQNCSKFGRASQFKNVNQLKYECPNVVGRRKFEPEIFNRFSSLRVVDLSHNQMSTLLNFSFTSHVQEIIISNNWLEKLPSDAFKNADNVLSINCSHNALHTLNDSLAMLHNLETLDLTNNEFSIIEDRTFENNTNMKHLYLEGNPIVHFKFRVFSSSAKHAVAVHLSSNIIVELDVSCEALATICSFGGFNDGDHFGNILHFSASGSGLQNVSDTLLRLGPNLKTLDLTRNNIQSLDDSTEAWRVKTKLENLNLSGNPLKQFSFSRILPPLNLPVTVYLPTGSIEELDVSCTSSTEDGSFCSFQGFAKVNSFENLKHLNASGKQREAISIVLAKIGRSIVTLDLSYNQIETLDSNVLKRFDNLKHLKWNHANISGVDANAFSSQQKLEYLDLSHNQLKRMEFRTGLTQLKELHLQDNQLTSIAGIVPANFPELSILTLAGNNFTCRDLRKYLTKINIEMSTNGRACHSDPASEINGRAIIRRRFEHNKLIKHVEYATNSIM